jgi:hypothetical protein
MLRQLVCSMANFFRESLSIDPAVVFLGFKPQDILANPCTLHKHAMETLLEMIDLIGAPYQYRRIADLVITRDGKFCIPFRRICPTIRNANREGTIDWRKIAQSSTAWGFPVVRQFAADRLGQG